MRIFFDKPRLRYAAARVPATTVFHMTNRFTLKVRLLALLLLTAACAAAQTMPAEIAENPERAAGIYHSYEFLPGPAAPVPAGYAPFYISHYSRHGSRYHASASTYTEPLEILRKAAGEGILTPKGREVLAKAEALAAGAEGRYGDLSPRGVAEHRAIAGRMYAAYPAVFSTRKGRVCRIESRSTQVPRCMLSMAAFNERLKELNPAIRITRDASVRDFGYMAYGPSMSASSAAALKVADSLFGARMNPGRVMKSLFTDLAGVGDPVKLMRQLYILTSVIQDADHLGIEPFYDIFTDRELYDLWACENVRRYLQMGPSARFGDRLSPMPNRCCAILSKRPGRSSRGGPTSRRHFVSATMFLSFRWWLCWASKVLRPGWSRSMTLLRRGASRRFPRWPPTSSSSFSATPKQATCVSVCCSTSATRACPSPEVRTIRGRTWSNTANRCTNNRAGTILRSLICRLFDNEKIPSEEGIFQNMVFGFSERSS